MQRWMLAALRGPAIRARGVHANAYESKYAEKLQRTAEE